MVRTGRTFYRPTSSPSRDSLILEPSNDSDAHLGGSNLIDIEGSEKQTEYYIDLEDIVTIRTRNREDFNNTDDLDISRGVSYRPYSARRNGQEIDRATIAQDPFFERTDPLRPSSTSSNSSIHQINPTYSWDALSPTAPTIFGSEYRNSFALETSVGPVSTRPSSSQPDYAPQNQSTFQPKIDSHAFRSSRRILPSRLRNFINLGRQGQTSFDEVPLMPPPPSQTTSRSTGSSRATLTTTLNEPLDHHQCSPTSSRRRQRFFVSQHVDDPEHQHLGDHNLSESSRLVDQVSEMRHRKRRRANSPAHHLASLSAPETVQPRDTSPISTSEAGFSFLSKYTRAFDHSTSRVSRSASTGGAPRPYVHADHLALNLPPPPGVAHIDFTELLSQIHPPLTYIPTDAPFTPADRSSPNALPREVKLGSHDFIFISETFPRSFTSRKRSLLTRILRGSSARIPAAVSTSHGPRKGIAYHISQPKSQFRARTKDLPLGPAKRGWPAGCLPVEVFDIIVGYLPRDCIVAMRLVNTEFEMKTSNRLFHTVVVPFRSEIYGMMTHKSESESVSPTLQARASKSKGKGKAKAQIDEASEEEKVVHDGMKVFEAWGPHIKKFAMAFEVNESNLENAPIKGKFEHHTTWWGEYEWPHPYYNRYEYCDGLEKKADEFKCMSKAMSYLLGTTELGLSLDSGLGWLAGPDTSDRAKLYQDKPEVFGRRHSQSDLRRMEQEEIWSELSQATTLIQALPPDHQTQDGFFEAQVMARGGSARITIPGVDDQPSHYPLIFEGVDLATKPNNLDPSDAARYATEGLGALAKSNNGYFSNIRLKPKDLTPAQQEWLLETEWAQRAFLSSFCMALADNSSTFRHVHTLNISKLSSRYLSALERDDVWSALPSMNNLTIRVSADWRDIIKSDTGIVESPAILPSKAATKFHALLKNYIAYLRNVKSLRIGYLAGGEHQVGIFGRNKGLLPGPLMDYTDSQSILQPPADVLALPYIENLTLSNCWLTPDSLKTFLSQLSALSLRHLSLDSVSLTSNNVPTPQAETIEISPSDGRYDCPQGAPRRHCPSVGNYFSLRDWSTPDPEPSGWTTQGVRICSWANVLDTITPGPTMDFTRYAFRYHNEPPLRQETKLEHISLDSCGYVCLTHFKGFSQRDVGEVADQLPHYLIKRAVDLQPVMMTCSNDPLVGQIVPSLKDGEVEALQTAFGMAVGWECRGQEGDDWENDGRVRTRQESCSKTRKKWENLEDGQPVGGSGRFGGVIERLVLPSVEG